MSRSLSRLLRREQFAFLARDKGPWAEHLARVRTFLGEGLQTADPTRPVLILGAGTGLEVPWALAPQWTTGWDADPCSRLGTALRHQRWAPWVFEDLTGGLADLEALTRRARAEPWSGRRRNQGAAAKRLAGLLPSLHPDPAALKAWILVRRPGTILVANVMGQFGVVAERLVETTLGWMPWEPDPERADPLAEALEAWTRRALTAFLGALRDSGADLWLVHDRAVVFSGGNLDLGPWEPDWTRQLRAKSPPIEASDALAGIDLALALAGCDLDPGKSARWIWPLAPRQRHVIETLALRRPQAGG